MNDNVISIGSRKTLEPQEVEQVVAATAAAELGAAEGTHKDANLKILQAAKHLVDSDLLEGVIVIGRKKGGKIFHTNLSFDRRILQREDCYAYIGVLEVLKLELASAAQMAPELMADGKILDCEAEPDLEVAE